MAMAVGGRGKEDATAVKLDTYIGLQSSLHHMVGQRPRKIGALGVPDNSSQLFQFPSLHGS